MIRGIYSAASQMIRAQRRQDAITQNLANATTTGYRADRFQSDGFEQVLQDRLNGLDPSAQPIFAPSNGIGQVGTGVDPDRLVIDFRPGAMRQTGNPLDLAIQGDGLFAVQTGDGEAYTRDGSFTLNAQRQLVTATGDPVLGANGPITLNQGPITIRQDGGIIQDGQVVGTLRIVAFADPSQARKADGTLLVTAEGGTPPADVANRSIDQGVLEGSNVDLSRSMTEMMSVMRSYESAQRALKLQDETSQKAANDIGKVNG